MLKVTLELKGDVAWFTSLRSLRSKYCSHAVALTLFWCQHFSLEMGSHTHFRFHISWVHL